MPDRLRTLERIADAARLLRQLERELVKAKDTRLVMDRLRDTRRQLDELLRELAVLDRGR